MGSNRVTGVHSEPRGEFDEDLKEYQLARVKKGGELY